MPSGSFSTAPSSVQTLTRYGTGNLATEMRWRRILVKLFIFLQQAGHSSNFQKGRFGVRPTSGYAHLPVGESIGCLLSGRISALPRIFLRNIFLLTTVRHTLQVSPFQLTIPLFVCASQYGSITQIPLPHS